MSLSKRIALVITDRETNAQIKNLGVGLLELRADLFNKLNPVYVVDQIKKRKPLKIPLLLTLRNQKKEGAVKTLSDQKKWEVITAALPLVDMIDIELSSPLLKKTVIAARKLGKMVIVSSHYLQDMPGDLESVLKKALKAKGDIVKIAAKAGSFDEVMRMVTFTHRHRSKALITVAMGPLGAVSRLLLPAAGSLYTYTFLNKPSASGQVDIATLKSHMKFYYPA